MILKISLITIIFISSRFISGQDCGTPSETCSDSKDCCGGCCVNNKCVETYDDCEAVDDPCLEFYCPPGMECYMYQPPKTCTGCEAQIDCRFTKSDEHSN